MPPHPPEHDDAAPEVVATPEMVVFCFDVLIARLRNHPTPTPPTIPSAKFPLFVTWKKGSEKRLRGCIGTFSHLNLREGLREYALTSALQDSRFSPIHINEVADLHCGVSILVKFERARDFKDWEIGKHGIRIHFTAPGQSYENSAVFLPEVSLECETVDNLIRKSGYKGQINDELRRSLRVVRFQSSKKVLSYADYLRFQSTH